MLLQTHFSKSILNATEIQNGKWMKKMLRNMLALNVQSLKIFYMFAASIE